MRQRDVTHSRNSPVKIYRDSTGIDLQNQSSQRLIVHLTPSDPFMRRSGGSQIRVQLGVPFALLLGQKVNTANMGVRYGLV
jgi:hypothetical protein